MIEHLFLAVDPITLTGLALGGLAAGGASALAGGGSSSAPTPTPAPTPAPAPTAPTPKATQKAPQSTFIGAAATPPTQSGQKTLLGQ